MVRWCGSTIVATGFIALVAGCTSTAPPDLASIADQEPLPYSVLVTGGGFVQGPAGQSAADANTLARTFAGGPGAEPVPLDEVVAALRAGRVFTRAAADLEVDAASRAQLAELRGALPLDEAVVRALLGRARDAGHDYLVLVQRVLDGPVEEYGINDRWPLTVSLWLLVGLGVFIPDHTFESRATLQASVYEVQTGRAVHRTVGGAGPTELALVSRGNLWSLVQSIIIPPFWVADHDPSVLAEMRSTTRSRLVAAIARQLKSASCRRDLEESALVIVRVIARGEGMTVEMRSEQSIGSVALRVDAVPVEGPGFASFQRELLASEARAADGRLRYAALLPRLPAGRYLQVLARTVGGQVASTTVDRRSR